LLALSLLLLVCLLPLQLLMWRAAGLEVQFALFAQVDILFFSRSLLCALAGHLQTRALEGGLLPRLFMRGGVATSKMLADDRQANWKISSPPHISRTSFGQPPEDTIS
jgi:hypothetical protein